MAISTASQLALQATFKAYEVWRDNKPADALPLTDGAKMVLAAMQSDPTDNGVFSDVSCDGDVDLPLSSPFSNIYIRTTERVMSELEAKGLVSEVLHTSMVSGTSDRRFKLTHAGWILNPETGKADKVG